MAALVRLPGAQKPIDEWHWHEKDLKKSADEHLQRMFLDRAILSRKDLCITCTHIISEGEAFVTKRKGKKGAPTYDLKVTLKWSGRLMLGENVIGTSRGRARIQGIAFNNPDPETWEVTVQSECEYKGQRTEEAEGNDLMFKNVMIEEGIPPLKARLDIFQNDLKRCGDTLGLQEIREREKSLLEAAATKGKRDEELESFRDSVLKKKFMKLLSDLAASGAVSGSDSSDDSESSSDSDSDLSEDENGGIVTQIAALSVKQGAEIAATNGGAKAKEKSKSPDFKEIRLTFSSLNDRDMQKLVNSIGTRADVERLVLSHNDISDVGIQILVGWLASGGAPELRLLDLRENKFLTTMAETMAQGLRYLRKDVKIEMDTIPKKAK